MQAVDADTASPKLRFVFAKLAEYCALAPPTPTTPLRFIFPGKINTFSLPFRRNADVDYTLEYILLTPFARFAPRDFFLTLSALLLECKVFVICADQAVLSAAILALLTALDPFTFAGIIITVPPHALLPAVEAPTPLLMGMNKIPKRAKFPREYVFFADLDAGRFYGRNVEMLPNAAYWIDEVAARIRPWRRQPNVAMTDMINSELPAARAVFGVVHKAVSELVADFDVYCLKNVYADGNDISFFLEESFVESRQKDEQSFYRQFVKTQLFANFKENRLDQRDQPSA